MRTDPSRWFSDRLARAAARCVRQRHPDWAQAMLSEHAHLAGERGALAWSLDLLRGGLAIRHGSELVYALALGLSLCVMTAYQWSADENPITLVILCLLTLGLGVLRPDRFIVSGLTVGLVVTAVNGFGTLTGVRPAYEIYVQSPADDLIWLVFLAPALASGALGRRLGLRLSRYNR